MFLIAEDDVTTNKNMKSKKASENSNMKIIWFEKMKIIYIGITSE